PLAAARLDATVAAPRAEAAPLASPQGCLAEGPVLRCAGATAQARLLAFAPEANWSAVAAARRAALGGADDEALTFGLTAPGMAWQVRQEAGRPMVAAAAWRDGAPAGDGLRARLAQALSVLRGDAARPVLVVVELAPDALAGPHPQQLRATMRALLAAQGEGLAAVAAARSARR
ncbi:hypothetical protein, partial [Falsiroseomonas sp.]|uniref:hypothetical protein n=1 Tax=Falsiroseomonas sp. TaxID=2870721 RepID=UPI003F6E6C64